MSEKPTTPSPEPQVTPKFAFPDLLDNPGGMMHDEATKTFWVGINMKVAEYNEACAILDSSKLTALNAYKKMNMKRILQPASSLQSMKNFVASKFK